MLQTYLDLLAPQHRSQPKLKAWLTATLTPFVDAQTCLSVMQGVFNLDTAVGVQLDTIGAYLGAPRTVGFQPSDGVSPILTDTYYRLVLRAKILSNQWDGTREGYENALKLLFSTYPIVIVDNMNMTIDIAIILGATDNLIADLLANGYLFPAPAGVTVNFRAAQPHTWAWYYFKHLAWTAEGAKTWAQL